MATERPPVGKFLERGNASDEKGWKVDVVHGNENGCAGSKGGSRKATWLVG